MSEVSKVSAAKQPQTAKKNVETPKKKGSGTEVADAMKTTNKQANKVPQKPVPKIITVTIGYGSSLGYIAEAHHTTVSEILKLNPNIKNADNIREGQQIKVAHIDDKEFKAYQDYQDKLFAEQMEKERLQNIVARKQQAQEKIQKAVKRGQDVDYTFSTDKEGYVIVQPLVRKRLHEIRSDLGLPAGHLDDMNNLEEKFGPIPTVNDGVRDIETWDNVKADIDDSFRIDPYNMNPSRTWTQFFKDIGNAILGRE